MSTEIFVSYAHEDGRYLEADSLLGHLRGVEKDGARFWTDGALRPGDKWDEKIKAQIEQTDIALLLVSQAFLLSEYCQNTEVSAFMNNSRHMGEILIFPVILSACDWKQYDWLQSRQCLPGEDKNIAQHFSRPPGKRIAMFQTITDALRERVKAVEQAKQAPPQEVAMEAASRSVNTVNKLYSQMESFHTGDPEEHKVHGVVFEGKGDHIVTNNFGCLTTFTADDLTKLKTLSSRRMRHLCVFQQDLEKCADRWEELYLRRRGESADARRETEREMRQVVADMKESLDQIFAFLYSAQLHIDDHYLFFLDLVERESRRAEGPAA